MKQCPKCGMDMTSHYTKICKYCRRDEKLNFYKQYYRKRRDLKCPKSEAISEQ